MQRSRPWQQCGFVLGSAQKFLGRGAPGGGATVLIGDVDVDVFWGTIIGGDGNGSLAPVVGKTPKMAIATKAMT